MSCYAVGDKMRVKDRTEERGGHERKRRGKIRKQTQTHTRTHCLTPFFEHFQTVTKVSAERKVKISISVATSHSSGDGESRKMKG